MQPVDHPMHRALFDTLENAKALLIRLRHFAAHGESGEPIQLHSRDYLTWLNEIGTPKQTAKWVAPIWGHSTLRAIAPEIYGKDPCVLPMLGNIKVASYIRYLMFERGWSLDSISDHLVDMGYERNSARPQARRAFNNIEKERVRWEREHAAVCASLSHQFDAHLV